MTYCSAAAYCDAWHVVPSRSPSLSQLAKEYHPDKNAGDETAKQRFQELAEAYQVRGPPETVLYRIPHDTSPFKLLKIDL